MKTFQASYKYRFAGEKEVRFMRAIFKPET